MAKDFVDLIESLNKHKVEYCIIGAYAVNYYTESRNTKDIDFLVRPTIDNLKKTYQALKDFGFTIQDPTPEELLKTKEILWLGRIPNRIDILQDVANVKDDEIWSNIVKGEYEGINTYYMGLKQLIKNELSTDRLKDKADAENMSKYHEKEFNEVIEEIKRNPVDKGSSWSKEPSTPYGEVSIRNEVVLNSIKGFPIAKQMEKEMQEAAKIIRSRKDFTQEQKHTLAGLLSSERFSALWYDTQYTPKMRVAAAELTVDPGKKHKILKEFDKKAQKIIERSYSVVIHVSMPKGF